MLDTDSARVHYRVSEIPDRFYAPGKLLANQGIPAAVAADMEALLRLAAGKPAGSLTLRVRFVYRPLEEVTDSQDRLRIEIAVGAREPAVVKTVGMLIERSCLRFYSPQRTDPLELPWNRMGAACDIVRRVDSVHPLISPDLNPRIPTAYYMIRPFEADEGNDYLAVDRLLDEVDEPVIIDLVVQPVDHSGEALSHTRYLSVLEAINSRHDEDDWLPPEEPILTDQSRGATRSGSRRRGLRRRDPRAQDMLQKQRRSDDTLLDPHLEFQLRVFAQRRETADLLGCAVAQSGFRDGNYRVILTAAEEDLFRELVNKGKAGEIAPYPVHEGVFGPADSDPYPSLKRLGHLASVKELAGVFRLPVASYNSPLCIRKNTDPPSENPRESILLGHDADLIGVQPPIPDASEPRARNVPGVAIDDC